MRVEKQGNKIQIVLKDGNQERWFTIEESEARELYDRLERVFEEPKFKVGDKVFVVRDDDWQDSCVGQVLTVEELLKGNRVSVVENKWNWPSSWLTFPED